MSRSPWSHARLGEIDAFKKRMGWRFHWVSSSGSDFNYDYHVSNAGRAGNGDGDYNYTVTEFPSEERPGASVFLRMQPARSTTRIQLMRGGLTY